MKKLTARRPLIAAIITFLSFVCSAIIAVALVGFPKRAVAETQSNAANTYYYSQLKASKLAQRFYNLFSEMQDSGYFLEGNKEYDLSSVLTQSELDDYAVKSSPVIPVALGAARDAFFLDHPELFYADVHKLVFTAGMKDGIYVASLGAGFADNYYKDNTVKSKAEARTAIADYEAELAKAVDAAKANNADIVQQIKNANAYISQKTDYSLGASIDEKTGNVVYNGNVGTAYGVFNSKASLARCEGYSMAFKAVMDKLGIPCVVIAGAACSGKMLDDGYGPHMWNAVQVEGHWYGVDVTWNDTENKLDRYTLVGDDFLSKSRFANPVISSSEFQVKYPALRTLDYGEAIDSNGFEFKDSGTVDGVEFGYVTADNDNSTLYLGVSYEGKNTNQLKAEGKYLAMRYDTTTGWVDFNSANEFWKENSGGQELVAGKYSYYMINSYYEFLQFAIVDIAPVPADENGTFFDGWANLSSDHIVAVSSVYNNKLYGHPVLPPAIKSMTPNEPGYIMGYDPVDISITYDEKLKYEDSVSKKVDITVTSSRDDIKVKVENVVWHEETNTITFRFTPSKSFAHNGLAYNFVPTNLIGELSGEKPDAGRLAFKFKLNEVICPKVFNDGRLYMKVFGTPQFVSASDESLSDFKDENGQPIVGDQRSQLMLVVNEPSKAESTAMKSAAEQQMGLADGDIMASSTYEISLNMCGKVRQVPKGSFMQVGFGFPYGYGPDDAGVTFTVYHYTRKANGEIDTVEEVPCVITEQGIIATVKSFSPFMICAVKSDSEAVKNTPKRILASVDGVGGTVDNLDIVSVENGGTVVYNITCDTDYSVYSVMLNGENVKDRVQNGKLTLNESEFKANNTVVVKFISARSAKYFSDNEIEVIRPNIFVTEKDMIRVIDDSPAAAAPSESNTGLIVGVVIAVIVVVALAAVALFLVLRKKKAGESKATANAKPKTSASVQAKPAVDKSAKQGAQKTTTVNRTSATNNTVNRQTAATTDRTANGAANRPTTTQPRPLNNTPNRPTSATPNRTGTAQGRPATTQTRPSNNTVNRPTSGTARTTVTPQKPANTTGNKPSGTNRDKK